MRFTFQVILSVALVLSLVFSGCGSEQAAAPVCGDGNLHEQEVCDDGNNENGDGCRDDCAGREACGDSLVDVAAGEVCDDGNIEAGDGCRADCAGTEKCGDGLDDPAAYEVCDDGNNRSGDGCRADCLELEQCGDGYVDVAAGEACDDGNTEAGDGCRADCAGLEECGDGRFDPAVGEICDDGNNENGDGCRADCAGLEVCGDGHIDVAMDELCDDGNTEAGDGCRADCAGTEKCGDGLDDPATGEVCDDGNNEAGDACRADCAGIEECGDGLLDTAAGEVCDDHNTEAGDGCRADCTGLEQCGDGLDDPAAGELCDDGNNAEGDGCRADCKGTEWCGDGLIDSATGEVCDDGGKLGGDGCRADCKGLEICGDGLDDPDAGEICDDGNTQAGDGCRADCAGYEHCGDGLVDTVVGEICDDDNTEAGDGCRADCAGLELCGDGLDDPDAGEICDDGNNEAGDGCRADCAGTEECGDGLLDPATGETCDDDNLDPGDFCRPDCLLDTPVTVAWVQPRDDAHRVVLRYQVTDPDPQDPVMVVALQVEDLGSGQVSDLTVVAGQDLGAVVFSALGQEVETVWDSLADLGLGNDRLVQVSIEVSDGAHQATALSAPFYVHNGPLGHEEILSSSDAPGGVVLGDINADGRPDVLSCSPGKEYFDRGVRSFANLGQSFAPGQLDVPPGLGGVPVDPLPASFPLEIPGPEPNPFLTALTAPSECVLLDADGDGDLDLIAADSASAPHTNLNFLDHVTQVLTDAGADEYILGVPGFFGDVVAHQVSLVAMQNQGAVNVASGSYQSLQATFNNIAGHVPLTGPTTYPPAAPTGDQGMDLFGWFVQDLVAAELDMPGAPGNGAIDLIALHAVRQLRSALMGDISGVVTFRQIDAGGHLGTVFYLDPTDMGVLPTHMAVADYTDDAHVFTLGVPDGMIDILIANAGDSSLTFYLGIAPSPVPGVVPPTFTSARWDLGDRLGLPNGDIASVAIGDLNGDDKNDFIAVGQLSSTVFVFIHDPDPAAAESLAAETGGLLPFRMDTVLMLPGTKAGRPAIADVNGDGRGDILVPIGSLDSLWVATNLGTVDAAPSATESPVFDSGTMFAAGFEPYEVMTDDLNGDQRSDVVVANAAGGFSVFYQEAPSTLELFATLPTGAVDALWASSGDLNGDGVDEIVVSLPTQDGLAVFERDAERLLTKIASFDFPDFPVSPSEGIGSGIGFPRIVDYTGDGVGDSLMALAQVWDSGAGPYAAWAGIRGGGLSADPVVVSKLPAEGVSVDAGDFLYAGGVPDGIPDIVIVSSEGDRIESQAGLDGTYFAWSANHQLVAGDPGQVRLVDLDGDGHLDAVVGSAQDQVINVFYNGGDAPADPVNPVVGNPPGFIGYGQLPAQAVAIDISNAETPAGEAAALALAVDHFGGPGSQLLDIAFSGLAQSSIGVVFQTAPRQFSALPLVSGNRPGQIVAGDFNGDGLFDIACPWSGDDILAVYLQNAEPAALSLTFVGPLRLATSSHPSGCAVADIDGDALDDLVVVTRDSGNLNIFLQR